MGLKLDTFVKLMELTTSSFDGEALTALRKANAMLRAEGQTWDSVLRPRLATLTRQLDPRAEAARARSMEETMRDDAEIVDQFERAFRRAAPRSSTYKFLLSMHDFWEKRGYVTPAQREKLREIAEGE